jgi:hypothetical protein
VQAQLPGLVVVLVVLVVGGVVVLEVEVVLVVLVVAVARVVLEEGVVVVDVQALMPCPWQVGLGVVGFPVGRMVVPAPAVSPTVRPTMAKQATEMAATRRGAMRICTVLPSGGLESRPCARTNHTRLPRLDGNVKDRMHSPGPRHTRRGQALPHPHCQQRALYGAHLGAERRADANVVSFILCFEAHLSEV